jgi:general secretion pathway protein G
MHQRQNTSGFGFTLVETLIVVAIIGLLMAIGIPVLLNSLNRAKQAQTLSDVREIASAWEARASEFRAYTAAGATFAWPAAPLLGTDVHGLLQPTYIRKVPQLDGWRRPYDFAADTPAGAQVYAIRSFGRDGKPDVAKTYTTGTSSKFDCDIVYSNGTFIVYPQGAQKN